MWLFLALAAAEALHRLTDRRHPNPAQPPPGGTGPKGRLCLCGCGRKIKASKDLRVRYATEECAENAKADRDNARRRDKYVSRRGNPRGDDDDDLGPWVRRRLDRRMRRPRQGSRKAERQQQERRRQQRRAAERRMADQRRKERRGEGEDARQGDRRNRWSDQREGDRRDWEGENDRRRRGSYDDRRDSERRDDDQDRRGRWHNYSQPDPLAGRTRVRRRLAPRRGYEDRRDRYNDRRDRYGDNDQRKWDRRNRDDDDEPNDRRESDRRDEDENRREWQTRRRAAGRRWAGKKGRRK